MTDMICTPEKQPTTRALMPSSRILCRICEKQLSQYTCPRCHSRSCSLHCYKSHNIRCTESFMKENVLGEMNHLQPDDKMKQKMLEVLKQFHFAEESDDIDEDRFSLSDETVGKILSGKEITAEDLSPEERRQFERAVASGELSRMIEPWEPWWTKPCVRHLSLGKDGMRLIQSLNEEDWALPKDNQNRHLTGIPSGPESPLPPLDKLSSLPPSLMLPFHLVDLLYSYCFTLRVYNGDGISDAIGSTLMVLSLSQVLGQAAQPESVQEVLNGCLGLTCSPTYKPLGGLNFGLGLIDDVIALISLGRSVVVCSLCDLRRLLLEGMEALKLEKLKKSKKSEILRRLKSGEKKIYFMMCWAHGEPNETWHALTAILKAEKGIAMDGGRNGNPIKMGFNQNVPCKVLIEEVQ